MIDRRDKYMELTKNTSVDPAKMIGKNYIEAVNAKFPNTILDDMKVGYLWYSGMMSVQFMATMPCTTCFPWKGK